MNFRCEYLSNYMSDQYKILRTDSASSKLSNKYEFVKIQSRDVEIFGINEGNYFRF